MLKSGKRFDRLLRVRTLQLGQVRAEEGRARAKVAHEEALRERIAQLAANVAPSATESDATSLIAAAQRIAVAERGLTAATEATREAKRDQSAIEKLIARADADAALKAIRALEAAPPTRKIRHDPC